jgi:hypothetical protein
MYGKGVIRALPFKRWRVYYGTWGSGLFQSVYKPADGTLASLPLMPEWYLVMAALASITALGVLWTPLLAALPLLLVGTTAVIFQAARGGAAASFPSQPTSRAGRAKLRVLTAGLHLGQPLARLWGRLTFGLTPWRRRGQVRFGVPLAQTLTCWSEQWRSSEDWLGTVETALVRDGTPVRRAGDYDRWDLETRGGLLGRARIRMGIEEHGAGRQLARFRAWPVLSVLGALLLTLFTTLAVAAVLAGAGASALVLAVASGAVFGRSLVEWSLAIGAAAGAVQGTEDKSFELRTLEQAGAGA